MWLGLVTGIIVFVICITGSVYVFEEEIRNASGKELMHVEPSSQPFIGLEQIILNFQKIAPKEKITSIRITENEPGATIQILNKKKKIFYFNPYTGSLVGKQGRDWLNGVYDLHTSLMLGETGKMIQGWSVVIFLLMLVTGLVLWYPARIKQAKQSLTIKWEASLKRKIYDLHNVLGFYASIFLIIIALTGTYFAFSGVKAAVGFVTHSKLNEGDNSMKFVVDPKANLAARYNTIYKTLTKTYPGAVSVTFSIRKKDEMRVRMIYPYQWSRKQNTFFFNQKTGELLRGKLYQNNNAADTVEAANYDLHTGKFFGIIGKILWLLASLVGASLPVTGFIMWWNKRKAKKKPKKKHHHRVLNKSKA
ncbi:PepSY domain-containing protein [Chryseobacterium sp. YIM B02567]|uniref:PepSY domain-containing protein n=1 Tax=Chryseobacterium paridis TaxID=2800328 RepID=A0ABS1FUG8_9FLAO|nr:PepSY domain-containing protein [Chryseobacterium paridis]